MSEWSKVTFKDIVDFNPRESIKKGEVAVKVGMDKLQPFCRDISEIEYEAFSGGAKFRNGDTIMARITPCLENGKTAMVNVLEEDQVGFGSTEYIVFRAKKGVTDPYFLYYLVCSPTVREPAIKSMVGSSGRQRVQIDVVQNLELEVPSLKEQKKIGDFLRKFDDKIAINNKINRNLEEQAQSIFQEWFINGSRYEKDANGNFIGVSDVSLAELMDYAGGSQPPASEFRNEKLDGYIRFVQIRDYETDAHITYIPVSSKNKLCDEYDIMIARYGASLGRICFGLDGAYNVALAKVFPKKPYYREFLRSFLLSKNFYEGLNSRGGRSAQSGFNQSDIKSFRLLFPDDDSLIKEYEELVHPLISARLKLKKENVKLAEVRDALLPKLMSGELDVSDLDI